MLIKYKMLKVVRRNRKWGGLRLIMSDKQQQKAGGNT